MLSMHSPGWTTCRVGMRRILPEVPWAGLGMRPFPFPNEMPSPAVRWRVEPVTRSHAPALERCLGTPEVAARFGLLRPLTTGEVFDHIARFVEDRALGAGFAFALVGAETGEPVGACHVG